MKRELMSCLVGSALLAAGSAAAQEVAEATTAGMPESPGPSAKAAAVIEEVIVTARKREESAQSVPVSVSAIAGKDLAAAGVGDVTDLSSRVPSLTIAPGPSDGKSTPSFTIRGQRQQIGAIYFEQSVGIYVGDIAVARAQGINQSLYDLQSVEVLKGPQGTLFGRNSTGGALLLKPARPTNKFEGMLAGTVANYDGLGAEVMLNQPLGESAALRIAGKNVKSEGYVTDVLTGHKIGGQDNSSFRVSLLVKPIDKLESLFVYNRFLESSDGTPYILSAWNPDPKVPLNAFGPLLGYTGANSLPSLLAAQQQRDYYETAGGSNAFTKVSTWDIANTSTYALNDSLSFKNIVGYRHVEDQFADDTDGSPLPILNLQKINDAQQYSEEFQLIGKTHRLDWVAGLFFFHEQGSNFQPSIQVKGITGGNAAFFGPLTEAGHTPLPLDYPNWSASADSGKTESKSVFAQGTFHLDEWVEGLSMTAGARYTQDDKEVTAKGRTATACRIEAPVPPGTTPIPKLPLDQCAVTNSKTFSEPTGTLGLEYKLFPKTLLYTAVRHGYRSGGFNGQAVTQATINKPFEPETITDLEFGAKSDWALGDVPVRTNLAVYRSDYKDVQRIAAVLTSDGRLAQTVSNAANATITGGEFEVVVLPTDGLQLSGFYSLTNAEYDDYEADGVDPVTKKPIKIDLSNQEFSQTPKSSYGLTARYQWPVGGAFGDVSTQASYSWTGHYFWQDNNEAGGETESYGLLNLNAEWGSIMQTHFDLSLFVKNATGEEYSPGGFSLQKDLGFASRIPGEPRTYGATIRYRFGAAT